MFRCSLPNRQTKLNSYAKPGFIRDVTFIREQIPLYYSKSIPHNIPHIYSSFNDFMIEKMNHTRKSLNNNFFVTNDNETDPLLKLKSNFILVDRSKLKVGNMIYIKEKNNNYAYYYLISMFKEAEWEKQSSFFVIQKYYDPVRELGDYGSYDSFVTMVKSCEEDRLSMKILDVD